MADVTLSLNEDQLLDNLEEANGETELMNDIVSEACFIYV